MRSDRPWRHEPQHINNTAVCNIHIYISRWRNCALTKLFRSDRQPSALRAAGAWVPNCCSHQFHHNRYDQLHAWRIRPGGVSVLSPQFLPCDAIIARWPVPATNLGLVQNCRRRPLISDNCSNDDLSGNRVYCSNIQEALRNRTGLIAPPPPSTQKTMFWNKLKMGSPIGTVNRLRAGRLRNHSSIIRQGQ